MRRPLIRAKLPAPDFVVVTGVPSGGLPTVSKRIAQDYRAGISSPANDTGKPAASANGEAR